MYIVTSLWKARPGKESEFEANGLAMRDVLRGHPGIDMLHHYPVEDGRQVVVMGYTDKPTYDKIINDPNGFFNTKVRDMKLEDSGEWLESFRGEEIA